MKLMRKSKYGFDVIISKFLRIFSDCGIWFCYVELPHHTIRLSYDAGSYIYNKKTDKYFW